MCGVHLVVYIFMKISSLSKVSLFIGLSVFPLVSFAQSGTQVTAGMGTLNNLIQTITSTVAASIATLLFSAALIAFFVGVVQYIWGAREGDQPAITKGNLFMKWSLIALFCMFSVYGIIRFGQNFLCNGPCSNEITIPNIRFTPGGSNAANQTSDPYSPGRANNNDVGTAGTAGRAGAGTSGMRDNQTGCGAIANEAQRDACFARQSDTTNTRASDTNYSCPSGKYGNFGECLSSTSDGTAGDLPPAEGVSDVGAPCTIDGAFGTTDSSGNCVP